MLDKLKCKRGTAAGIKSKIKTLGQELEELERVSDTFAIEIATLEEERAQLCENVLYRADADSEWSEAESQPAQSQGDAGDVDMKARTGRSAQNT